MINKSYETLFEPLKIGPVTAPNRFYQVPHCNGMGHRYPKALAAMRGIKAEGGWGVVCTEEVEIHPTSDLSPYGEGRLWDDRDIPAHRRVTDAIHAHGALAGIELVHNGFHASNKYSRLAPLAPSAMPVTSYNPIYARAMDASDIAQLRTWYRQAALRARDAGYDIIYVYAGHDMTMLMHFLLPRYNQRSDEYGGSLENRVRLLREVLTETKEAVGATCGVALRFAVDELMGPDGLSSEGEGRDIVEMLAELPDLWDVNISDWSKDSATFRFQPNEGYQTPYTAFVKSVTTKPVVGVGRFTSPDEMARLIRSGTLDLIGAARPSIADPFLPNKIKEGRVDEIRECIGCNICVSGDNTAVPMRCTQNPTMGEEWRRGWHPEQIAKAKSAEQTLVVGAGPAGLEATLQLALRGHKVILAEARDELGGRCLTESALPGMGSYRRVADYRVGRLVQMANVEIYKGQSLSAQQILEFDIPNVVLATGASWNRDGTGRANRRPIKIAAGTNVLTPDDVMAGAKPTGRVMIFDDEHYYMGGVIAEHLAKNGCPVTLVTPLPLVSNWTENTLEQDGIQQRLLELDVEIIANHNLVEARKASVELACVFTARRREMAADAVVLVTALSSDTKLEDDLRLHLAAQIGSSVRFWARIGDCAVPGTIAASVYSGHKFAREFQETAESISEGNFARELPEL